VLRGDAAALAAARRATSGLPQATITTVEERPRPLSNLAGGQAISARAGSATYVITAGHCTKAGGTWLGYNAVTLGPVSGTNFLGDDFGSIRVSSFSWTPTAQVMGTASVLGSTEAPVGAAVCRSGSSTGYRSGTIQAKNQTVNYLGGNIVNGLTKTNVCAEPGESGGSFVSGRQAQGLTSGRNGSCSSGGTTYFQPINEVLTRYGMTLVVDPPRPVVTLCSDDKYTGRCSAASTISPSMAGSTVGDNTLSSIRVPAGAWLLPYRDANHAGVCQAFNADESFLRGTTVGNDTVSSYLIQTNRGNCPTS